MNMHTKAKSTDETVAYAMRELEDKINRLARMARLADLTLCDAMDPLIDQDEGSALIKIGRDDADNATLLTTEVSIKAQELLKAFYAACEGRVHE